MVAALAAAMVAAGAFVSALLVAKNRRSGSHKRRRAKSRFNARLAASTRSVADGPPAPARRSRPSRPPGRGDLDLDRLTPRQVSHHVLALDNGQQVGVSVAGAGLPFVLLHGIGFHNRTYERCMSYLPEFGFLAVAIEAPGHGRSSPAPRGADFATRVDVIRRALDALGIRRAIVAGHSMGGRSAACFTALNPERVLAAAFIDAALGESWDLAVIRQLSSEAATMRVLVDGLVDAVGDTRNISWPERLAYYRMLSGPGRPRLADLARTPEVARAIAVAESAQWLAAIRAAAVPVVVLQGGRDLTVPLEDARAVARSLDAPLLTVPDGYHAWLLASPRTFAGIMAEIFADPASIAGLVGLAGPAGFARPAGPAAKTCLDADALVLQWSTGTSRPLPPRPDKTVLDWQIELPAGIR